MSGAAHASVGSALRPPTSEEIIALWNKIAKEAMDKVEREFQEAEQLPANFPAVRQSRAHGYAVLSFYDTIVSTSLHSQRRESDAARLRLVAAILKYVGDEVGGEIGTDIEVMDPRVVLAKAEAVS